jgi:hypothetical protein
VISGATAVNTRAHFVTTFAREAAGALGTRHSPRPLFGRYVLATARARRAAGRGSLGKEKRKATSLRIAYWPFGRSRESNRLGAGAPKQGDRRGRRHHHRHDVGAPLLGALPIANWLKSPAFRDGSDGLSPYSPLLLSCYFPVFNRSAVAGAVFRCPGLPDLLESPALRGDSDGLSQYSLLLFSLLIGLH